MLNRLEGDSLIDIIRSFTDEGESGLIELNDGTSYEIDVEIAEIIVEHYDRLSSDERNDFLERLGESIESFLALTEEIGLNAEGESDE